MVQAEVPWRTPLVTTVMGFKFVIKIKSSKVTLQKLFQSCTTT